MIYHHQKKTRKRTKYRIKSKSSHKRTFKNNNTLPDGLLKYYNKHKPQNYNFIWISNQYNSHAQLHLQCDLINKFNYAPHIITLDSLKTNFKIYFPEDYFNFIEYSYSKIVSKIPSITYKKKPIIFEAYLMIISKLEIFKAYMFDLVMMKIQGILGKKHFPNNYDDTFENVFLIVNQIFKVLKYISIILSNNARLFNGCKAGFEIFKVDLEIDETYGIKLLGCSIKTDWDSNSFENKQLYAWIDNVIFNPFISKKKTVQTGFSTQLLYEVKYQTGKAFGKVIPSIYASQMKREDFGNQYVLFTSDDTKFREWHTIIFQKKLAGYGLKHIDMFSSVGMNLAFYWYVYEGDKDVILHKMIQKRRHYNILCYLANMLDQLTCVEQKNTLYINFKNMFPDEYLNFLAKSYELKQDSKYSAGEILIAKPINMLLFINKGNKRIQAFQGADIIVIDRNEKMNDAKQLLKKYDNVLVCKYITNPLLFKTRKFHFRCIFIVSIINNKFNSYFLDTMRIITAKLPFKLSDFSNPEIHDSHLKSTDADYYFPQDFTTENMGITITPEIITTLLSKIRDIMKKVAMVAANDKEPVKLYNNHKNGFHILGPDIMITQDLNPILLEINSSPTYKRFDKDDTFLDNKLFNLIDEVILKPTFSPDNNTNHRRDIEGVQSLYSKMME